MASQDKQLVSVVGASSKQGRSVALSLLRSGRFRVRALTSRLDTPVARTLAAAGAELRRLPLQLGQGPALRDAFAGADAAFLMTPPIAPPDRHEAPLGRELADAASAAGVGHIVFSSLENVEAISGGRQFAPHFTDKAIVADHIRGLPVRSTFVMLAFFYTNLMEYYAPRQEGDALVFPIYLPEHSRAPFVDPTAATGPAVLEILSDPDRYAGASLPVIGDILSPAEMVATFTRVTGRKAEYRSAYERADLLRYFPDFAVNEPLVQELLGMVHYAVDYGYYRPERDLDWSRQVDPNSPTWEQFLRTSNWDGRPHSFGA